MIQIISAIWITLIYVALAVGKVPNLRMNRATIALTGAAILLAIGAVSESQALAALDTGTILLLAAMMVINANLRLSGFFQWVAAWVLRAASTPLRLLALVILLSGLLSALFLNDTICLMFTPLVVDLTLRLKRNPIPYLVGLATATNIGSSATLTGNPQNLIIGQASGISYLTFSAYQIPVALVGLLISWGVIAWLYRDEFSSELIPLPPSTPLVYRPLLARSLGVVGLLLVAFLAGMPIVSSACIAAGALLISRIRPQKLLELDWELLAFFGGLFVVTGTLEASGLSEDFFRLLEPVLGGGVLSLSLVTALLSNLVSNVPAVLLLRPHITELANPQSAWLTLAMASTLAGNFTLLGSAANLIVAEIAKTRGVELRFMEYLKAGVPITVLTLLWGILWLSWVS